jgi:hypothetical protein
VFSERCWYCSVWPSRPATGETIWCQPPPAPIVVGDVIVAGGTSVGAGDSGVRWKGSTPEDVRGYDVRTGAHVWTFHVVPREGEFGVDTWGDGSWAESGDLGAWCCLSAGEELGFVYVPLTVPTAAVTGASPGTTPSMRVVKLAIVMGGESNLHAVRMAPRRLSIPAGAASSLPGFRQSTGE